MRILFDIGHPAHVHYFKNLIRILKNNGHTIFVTARSKSVIFSLLDFYEINYISRGRGSENIFGKFIYMLLANFFLLKFCLRNKPDVLISFSSPYSAQVSKIINKPHLCFNDTEHTDKTHKIFTYPFSKYIFTPKCYYNSLGIKHKFIESTMENFYLSKRYFNPDIKIFDHLGISKSQNYVFLRFVSWKAHHDIGQYGIDHETKYKIIDLLSKKYKVYISSEYELSDDLKKYEVNIPIHMIHSMLYYSKLFIGESATMAAESSFLGVFSIYTNSLPLMSYLRLYQNEGLLVHVKKSNILLDYVKRFLNEKHINRKKKQDKNNYDPNLYISNFLQKNISSE